VSAFDTLPFQAHEFDLVVVHGAGGLLTSIGAPTRVNLLRECHRVLRPGGRLIAIEAAGRTRGLSAFFRARPVEDPAYEGTGGTLAAVEAAGFRPARRLAESEGYRFTEGFRGGVRS
jgi:SAM-dependent methyltransferase